VGGRGGKYIDIIHDTKNKFADFVSYNGEIEDSYRAKTIGLQVLMYEASSSSTRRTSNRMYRCNIYYY
jgi:hypothetical protein